MTINTALERKLDRVMKGHDRREELVFGYPHADDKILEETFLTTLKQECFQRLEVVHYYVMNNTLIASIYIA